MIKKKWQMGLESWLHNLENGTSISSDEIKKCADYYENQFMFDEEEMTPNQADYWYRKIEKLKAYCKS